MRIIILAGILFFSGCVVPIKDDLSGTITIKEAKVEEAIINALTASGWRYKVESQGHIIAQKEKENRPMSTGARIQVNVLSNNYNNQNTNNHVAQIDILFDRKRFKIKYKNSSRLKYDGENIHSLYNKWVSELQRAINSYTRKLSLD